jgi:hypothetical protein
MLQLRSRLPVLLTLLLCTLLLLLQSPLAPFGSGLAWTDSGVYIYCAKEIMAGKIMYTALFDHKGPVIYLLNIIGLMLLRGNLTGIWLLELTAIYTSVLLFYKTARLFATRFTSLCCSIYTLIALIPLLEQGNLTEEYALPFISWAVYRFAIFFNGSRSFRFGEVSGISFCCGLTFLLRANMIAPWIGFSLVTIGLLLYQQGWRDLIRYSLWALAGLSAALLPFLIYFMFTGSLTAFWTAFWTFNQLYSAPSAAKMGTGLRGIANILGNSHLILLFICYLLYLLLCYRRLAPLKHLHLALIVSCLVTFVLCCGWSGHVFAHYAITCIPLSLFTVFLFRPGENKPYHGLILSTAILILTWPLFPGLPEAIRRAYDKKPVVQKVADIIRKHAPPGNQILILGNNCKFYFMTETHSCSRYFYQYPIADIDPSIRTVVSRDVIHNKPVLILEQATVTEPELQQCLQQFYTRHEEEGEVFYLLK